MNDSPNVVISSIDGQTPVPEIRNKFRHIGRYASLFVLAISLTGVFVINSFSTASQDIRSRASENSGIKAQHSGDASGPGKGSSRRVLFIEFKYRKNNIEELSFEIKKPKIKNGYTPQFQTVEDGGRSFTAVALNAALTEIGSYKFSVPTRVIVEGLDEKTKKKKGESRQIFENDYGLTIPYRTDIAFIKILGETGELLALFPLEGAGVEENILDTTPTPGIKFSGHSGQSFRFSRPALASGGTFNIAIIGDHYAGNAAKFQQDVTDIVNGLVSIEPFASYKANISVYTRLAANPICQPSLGWPSIKCNDSVALYEASNTPYDKVYVLYDGPYTGYAYVGGKLSYGTSSTDQSGIVKQGLFIHEMAGHTLGGLMDEYDYGTTGTPYGPNCSDTPSCPLWMSFTGLGCFQRCGYSNLYRATNNGVMNASYFDGRIAFDAFAIEVLRDRLAPFVSMSGVTVVGPTSSIPTRTPTLTPFATPMLSPTPILNILTPTNPPIKTPTPTKTGRKNRGSNF